MNSFPNNSFIAASSGIIWNFVIKIEKNRDIIIPPIRLNLQDKDNKIINIPRYIGFLENLNIPEVTKEDACLGSKGLTVVFCLLNDLTADKKTNNPKIRRNRLIILLL